MRWLHQEKKIKNHEPRKLPKYSMLLYRVSLGRWKGLVSFFSDLECVAIDVISLIKNAVTNCELQFWTVVSVISVVSWKVVCSFKFSEKQKTTSFSYSNRFV